MNIKEYASQTRLTAKYPGSGSKDGLTYVSLGLIGETGEVAEHIKKMMRDDGSSMTDDRREKLIKELGDVMWYWSEGRRCLGIDPPVHDTIMSPVRADLPKLMFALAEAAAAFATAKSDSARSGQLAMVRHVVGAICDRIKVSLDDVLEQNAAKLQRRLAEDKISGSGSDR